MNNLQSTLDDVVSELGQVFADYRDLVDFSVFASIPNNRKAVFIVTEDHLRDQEGMYLDEHDPVVYSSDEDKFYIISDRVEEETEAYRQGLLLSGLGSLHPLKTALLSGLVRGSVHRSAVHVGLPDEYGKFLSLAAVQCFDEQTVGEITNLIKAGYGFCLHGLRVSLQGAGDPLFLSERYSDEFVTSWITDNALAAYFSKRGLIENPESFRGFVSGINSAKDLEEECRYAAVCLRDLPKFNPFLMDYFFGTVAKTLYHRCTRGVPSDSIMGAVRELLLGGMQDIASLLNVYKTRGDFAQLIMAVAERRKGSLE